MPDPHDIHDPNLHQVSTGPGADSFVRDTQGQTLKHGLETLLEHLATGFMTLDYSWLITNLSPQPDPLLAQTRAALLGKTLWEVFPQVVGSPFYKKYHEVVEARSPVHFEEFYPPLNKWFEVHISPSDESIAVFLQDITPLKRAEEELSKLAAIVESSEDAIFSKTLDGVVISWNRGAERLYGYSANEMIGKAVDTLVPIDRRQEFQEIQRIAHVETVRLNKDGRPLAVSLTISPVRDARGTMIGASTIAQDLSKQAESEAGLRRLADSNILGIVFWDINGDITQANDYFLKLVGYTREELLAGRVRWKDMTPSEYALVDARAIEEMQAHGFLSTPFEKEYLRKDGSSIPVLIGSMLLATSQREGVSFILDVSERKELRQKDDFISMASHELRTPLTSLLGYTELLHLLLEREGSQQAVQCVAKIEAQLEKLTRLIADLLDISKAQAGKLTYIQEPVVLDGLVREIVEDVQLTTPRHRILIEGKTACELIGDRDRLGQVVLNLLSNAIKYSPQAQAVVVRLARTPEEVAVSVQDFGIGIPSHAQARVFERFYRGSNNVEKRFSGLGVGLYIAHQIIAHHGGRMWVESVEGQGSTFSFALRSSGSEAGFIR